MDYTKLENEHYNLHLIQTNRFKTINVIIDFKRKLKKDEITIRNVLCNNILEGTHTIPSRRMLEIKTEELYDLAYRCGNCFNGKYSILSFGITYINPKYTESKMHDESFKFLSDLIFDVNVSNNKFCKNNFDIAKKTVKDNIDTISENVSLYSQIRMLEEMEDSIISYRNCGYLEDLNKITEKNLYDYYLDIINNDSVNIFIIGDIDINTSNELVNKYFKFSNNKKNNDSHFYIPKKISGEVNIVSEKFDKEQSTLVVGFKIDKMTDFERRYVSTIYNYILGGSTESNLFKTVREENSLCYYITSSIQPLLNIGLIRAGINAKDFNKVEDLIYKELKKISEGVFDDNKINNAITTYISSLSDLEDNPRSIISLYAGIEYLKSDDIKTRKEKIVKVTKNDIINFSKKIHLSTIYLLEGNDDNEEE